MDPLTLSARTLPGRSWPGAPRPEQAAAPAMPAPTFYLEQVVGFQGRFAPWQHTLRSTNNFHHKTF